ncbi:hypothetical protein TKK_0003047 [Trichogramma kaykai]
MRMGQQAPSNLRGGNARYHGKSARTAKVMRTDFDTKIGPKTWRLHGLKSARPSAKTATRARPRVQPRGTTDRDSRQFAASHYVQHKGPTYRTAK